MPYWTVDPVITPFIDAFPKSLSQLRLKIEVEIKMAGNCLAPRPAYGSDSEEKMYKQY